MNNPYSTALLRSWSPGIPANRLAGITISDFIGRRATRHDGPILAVIDQPEELLAESGPRFSYRRRFLSELRTALDKQRDLHLLLLVRDETLGLFSDELQGGVQHHLGPLTFEGATEAVTCPVAVGGRAYAPGAVDSILSDLQTSRTVRADGSERVLTSEFVEPVLLQVVCAYLWRRLPALVETITTRDICRYADVSTALSVYCSQVIATVANEHEMTASRLRSWLMRTFLTEEGKRADAYEGPTDTAGLPNTTVRALEDQHLLSASYRSGSRWYELRAERLVEPLRQAAVDSAPRESPADYLQAAQRTLSLADLGAAERYARMTLNSAADSEIRLRAEANSLLGNIEYERGKSLDAEQYYQKAAAAFETIQDTSAVAYQLAALGQTMLAQRNLSGAVAELRAAVDRMPRDPVIHTALALALWQLGQGRAAAAVLSDALSIDGGNRDALFARGEILADLGEAREALSDLNRVTVAGRPSAQAARGLALALLGDHRAAAGDIEAAIIEAPHNGPALLYAARATALTAPDAAVELVRRAVEATDPELSAHQSDLAQELLASSWSRRY